VRSDVRRSTGRASLLTLQEVSYRVHLGADREQGDVVRSMTGFGKASRNFDGDEVTMELSSVNHRYLDAVVRLPSEWGPIEMSVRESLKDYLSRGKVNVSVSRKRSTGPSSRLTLDRDLAEQYIRMSRELQEMMGSTETLSLQTIAQFEDLYSEDRGADDLENVRALLTELVDEAASHLNAMRASEGRSLARDLLDRIGLMRARLGEIEARLPVLNELYLERLRTRIREVSVDVNVADERLEMEVALAAERGDVTEEVVRLKSHFEHAEDLLRGEEASGRKLNFLAQEMQREMNTLGSKVRDTDVVRHVLELKSELERVREQIQNIE